MKQLACFQIVSKNANVVQIMSLSDVMKSHSRQIKWIWSFETAISNRKITFI